MNNFLLLLFSTLIFANSYDLALEALDSKEYKNALDIINELVKKPDVSSDTYYLASQLYYAIGDLDNANSSILSAIEMKNDSDEYRKYQKKLESLRGDLKSAQKTFDNSYIDESISEYIAIAEKFPKSPIPFYSLAVVYKNIENYSLAVKNFNKALSINPYGEEKYLKAIRGIAQRLAKFGKDKYNLGEYDEALNFYLEAVDYYPEYSSTLFRICITYFKIRDYEKAKIFAEKTLLYDPDNYQAMKILGDLYYALGDIKNSIDFYNQSINVNPQDYKSYYSLSKVLNEQGQGDEAISNLEKTLSINSKYEKAYILLGVIYSDREDYEKSIYNLNKAIDVNEKNHKTFGRLANAYNQSSQYEEAKLAAKKSLQIKRNYGAAFFELGLAEFNMCNKVASVDAFDKAKKDKNYRQSAKYYLDNMEQLFATSCK